MASTAKTTRRKPADEAADPEDSPAATSVAWQRMAEAWPLIEALDDGDRRIKEESSTWVPKWEKEDEDQWAQRVQGAVLFNQFKSTLKRCSNAPFTKGITFAPVLPELLLPTLTNADMRGTPLVDWCCQAFCSGNKYGLSFGFVDHPPVSRQMSMLEVERKRIYPYYVLVRAPELIGFGLIETASGMPKLGSIRMRKSIVRNDGRFGQVVVEQIREFTAPQMPILAGDEGADTLLEAETLLWRFEQGETGWQDFIKAGGRSGSWTVWEKAGERPETGEEEWTALPTRFHSYPGIPLATFYCEQVGFMEARPPHQALADENLAHFRSTADQKYALAMARVATPWGTGVTDEEKEAGMTLGSRRSLMSVGKDAEFGLLEVNGAGMLAGEHDLDKSEQRMETYGAIPFVERRAGGTATGQNIDNEGFVCDERKWATAFQNFLLELVTIQARWLNSARPGTVVLPKDQVVRVNRDFRPPAPNGSSSSIPLQLNQRGLLPNVDTLREAQRRGEVDEDLNAEKAVETAQEEMAERVLVAPDPLNPGDEGGEPGKAPAPDDAPDDG